jgi:alkylated DNA repair dioxygenase AlkB
VLVNRYRDGRDSMGWHADAEPELGEDPPLATLSLGTVRRFLLKPRRASAGAERRVFELGPGSLLLMTGATQRHYVHCLPRAAGVADERLSLTFRRVLLPG